MYISLEITYINGYCDYLCLFLMQIVFADDNNRTIYVSTDEGESYTYYSVPVDPKSLLFHPTEKDWILGLDDIQHVCGYSV